MRDEDTPEFRPHFGLGNPHAQTICSLYYPYRQPDYVAQVHEIEAEDGDRLVVHDDCPSDWKVGTRCVVSVHGLGGCHRSGHIARLADKLTQRGIRCFRMDQRGCGAGALTAKGHTHAGRSEDLEAVIDDIRARCPGSKITAVGFSMGGNILLKLLSEYAAHPPSELDSALVVAPPIDLVRCAKNIRLGFNKVYDRSFVKRLHRMVRFRRKRVEGYRDLEFESLPRQIYHFDDAYTAPLAGFRDADDYYTSCSTYQKLAPITVPTALITAKDDPLIPFQMFTESRLSSAIELFPTEYGGHIGYLGVQGVDPDRWWLDWRIVEYITGLGTD